MLTEVEARSRYEVKLEKYTKLMNIEVRTMKRMTRRTFLPAINKYATLVANEINEMKAACTGIDTSVQDQLLNTVVMWTPALAVWLMWLAGRRSPVLSFSLRPALRRNWKWYLAAWALSLAAAVLGALLYFGVYPRDFDSTLPALAPMMEQAGISRSTVVSLLLGYWSTVR